VRAVSTAACLHGEGFRIVDRHGFLAEHVLAGAQGGDGLRGVQEDGVEI